MADEAELTRRISERERRMDLLFDHLKVEGARLVPQTGDLGPEVRAPLERGDELSAIALVCDQTGMGLAEAKRIEQMVGGS